MKAEKTQVWILAGPGLLLAAIALLYYKTAYLLPSPAWFCGLGISIALTSWISYMAFQELRALKKNQFSHEIIHQKVEDDLRAVLDETHLLYRQKVAKLEEEIFKIENDQMGKIQEKEIRIEELEQGYEKIYDEAVVCKNQANSFRIALEDALEELGRIRQLYYLSTQPKNQKQKKSHPDYLQLKEQFEEKSLVLDETRRELFEREGELLALQKEIECKGQDHVEIDRLFQSIEDLLAENEQLNQENKKLEQLIQIAKASKSKSSSPKKKRKKKEEALEFQFE